MATVQFSAVTTTGITAESEAASVTVPTADGEITVLANHIPLVSVLVPGVVTVRGANDQSDEAAEHLAVSGGFLQVTAKAVTILADTAERAGEIDLERAEAARKRAAEAMSAKAESAEMTSAAAALQKNLARLQAAELGGRRHRNRNR